jgi:GMP reductase
MRIIERELHYDDVYLIPQKAIIGSRSEADISMTLGKMTFDIPVFPANMRSVVTEETCEFLARQNIFYSMHRICDYDTIIKFVKDMNEKNIFVSISVGMKQGDRDMLQHLCDEHQNIDYITIDVAHAHNDKMLGMIDFIKELLPNVFLIVGNVATGEAIEFFERHGNVDCCRVGISCGYACSTKNTTGFNRKMISTLLECGDASDNLPLIADGGISENGDYIKALNSSRHVVGVMAGKMFAGFEQSAGDILVIEGNKLKEYYGNASEKAKGNSIHVEGVTKLVPYKGCMSHYINEIKMALSSSVSYAGKQRIADVYGIPMVRCK